MNCDRCGVESEREEFFRVVPQPFRKRRLHLCPSCAAKQGDNEAMQVLWLLVGLWGALIVLSWFTPDPKVEPFVWNLGLVSVFLFGSTVAHELGHVFAGRLVGMHITGIEIGRGPLIIDFQLWGFQWQFRAAPFGGFTVGVPQGGGWVRLRQSLFILGGPLANLLLIVLALTLTGLANPLPHDFMERFSPGTMLLIANALFVFGNLIPFKMDTSRGKWPTDGLQLWRTWCRSPEEVEVIASNLHASEAQGCLSQRKNAETIVVLWEGLNEHPDEVSLEEVRAHSLLCQGKAAEARRIYAKILGRYSKFEQLRYTMFNNIAWTDVLMGDPALMWEADAGSRLALEAQPSVAPFKGTRGAVLVEMGDLDAGLRLLHEALRENEDDRNKALNACFIGIANARRSDLEQCRSYFALARRLDPECVLLAREPKPAASEPGSS